MAPIMVLITTLMTAQVTKLTMAEEPTGPNQPTYDSSDMGQFWLDVFRCQADKTSPG